MNKPSTQREGKILADLHTHLSVNELWYSNGLYELLPLIASKGILGIAAHTGRNNILTYDQIVGHYEGVGTSASGKAGVVEELEPGLVAKVSDRSGNVGYIVKVQEVLSSNHILVIGLKDYIETFRDPRWVVADAKKRGALTILAHPCVTSSGLVYRLINSEEEKVVRELCDMVDAVEVFNAQCINLVPGAMMKRTNARAKELAAEYNKPGFAASDAHSRRDQIFSAGIYLPKEETLTMEGLKSHIRSGNFERLEGYVSRFSFLMGHIRDRRENRSIKEAPLDRSPDPDDEDTAKYLLPPE